MFNDEFMAIHDWKEKKMVEEMSKKNASMCNFGG